jgi:acetolactate synthase-1/2/3 large subunit
VNGIVFEGEVEMATCGEVLVSLLEAYEVKMVFGIPGVHTVELYRGLAGSNLRHVTPRHEQGAGFMADGYARTTGKPGVCFIITGPGMTNIATAMAQAFSDSVPMLVISSVNRTQELGLGGGQLHELPSQKSLTAQFTEFSHTLMDGRELPQVLARAFTVFEGRRPAPVHIEIPVDVIKAELELEVESWPEISRPSADPRYIEAAAGLLETAKRPLIYIGGGTIDAGSEIRGIAEKLGAPVVNTVAAKGVLPGDHDLCLDCTMAYPPVRELIRQADVLLAVGTEFSETDRYGDESPLEMGGKMVRIDIDSEQLARNHQPVVALQSDAKLALTEISRQLQTVSGFDGRQQVAQAKALLQVYNPHQGFLKQLRAVLPADTIVAGDSTQPIYSANSFFPVASARTWINSTTGYGTLGYGLPAAIGAKLANPDRPVVAIVGDGGLMFTLPELATAVEEELSLPVIIWNNMGYGEIRDYMTDRNIPLIGVDLYTPDFCLLARGFGCHGERAQHMDHFKTLLTEALSRKGPSIIEVMEK